MTTYAVVVGGQGVGPGTPHPGAVVPHPGAVPDEPEPEPRACTELTKAGEPCKGTPGDDGLCAAHKKTAEADSEDG
jgi:hypothetical protein